MYKFQFIFEGGFDNHFFQFLVSTYIKNNFQNVNISYGLSQYILGRHQDLNLIKKWF